MMERFVFGVSFKDSLQDLQRSEATDCPVCPDCPDGRDAYYSSESNDIEISGGWLLVGCVVLVVVVLSVMKQKQRKWRRNQVLERASNDVELRQGSFSDTVS